MSLQVTVIDGRPAMSFKSGNDLLTNVILSLEIEQGSFFADPLFGLKARPQAKKTLKTARLIKGDVEQALQWLLDTGRAALVEVEVALDNKDLHRVLAAIVVTDPGGNRISYEKFVEVV